MHKLNKIPTILGIVILVVGTFAGVFFLKMNQIFQIGASPTNSPKDIRVGNLTDTSATISWATDGSATDFIIWGDSQGNVNKIEKETENDQKFFTHNITLTGLKANTTYYYKINSEGTEYDNQNIPWQFTTGAEITSSQSSFPISGSVITALGKPSSKTLVYMTVEGYLMSTQTSDTGNFVLQLGNARTSDLRNYIQIDPAKTLLDISVTAGPDGVASAQIYPQSAKPIPPMVLGQVYDYRNLQPTDGQESPNANLNLPENSTPESKFKVATTSGSTKPTSVILESITEGEVITSTQPQFFGKGPGGESITITVHSEAVTDTVTIPNTGSWSWSPPSGLEPGAHTITISWIDTTGITRSLTRNFVVQAGELPAFEATPSQTLAPSGSPAATIKPTSTPKPTAIASAAPVPVTGSLTPTLLLSIMGLAVLLFSISVWKIAEN